MNCIKAKDVRRTLELLLTNEIGQYVFANGATTPSIAVRAESERLPTGTKAYGMEVIVMRYPEQAPVRQYLNETAEYLWTVFLVGWDDQIDLTESAAKILDAFPGSEFIQLAVPKAWGPTNQIRVTLKNPWVFPDDDEPKDVDGGYFHPVLVIPATKEQFTLDGGLFTP